MNKLSKIFLAIIIILLIALGIMTYYYFYWRDGYLKVSNDMVKTMEAIHSKGYDIKVENKGNTFKMVELFSEEGK